MEVERTVSAVKAWLRKWWVLLALFAGFLILVSTWTTKPKSIPFHVGTPLPLGKVKPQIICFWGHAILLAPDGSLWGWGAEASLFGSIAPVTTPIRIGGDSDWVSVSSGWAHCLAIKSDGSLLGWGLSNQGQLATNSPTPIPAPMRIGLDSDWVEVSSGMSHVLALKRDGSLWSWGGGGSGQCGDGSMTNLFAVTRIGSDSDWSRVSAGSHDSYGLKRDGTIWGWGANATNLSLTSASVPVPTQIDPGTNWASISAGAFHLLALQADGSLWVRGGNAHSVAPDATGVPTTSLVRVGSDSDWREVHCGDNHFFARKTDGSWWACGQNHAGQLGIGTRGGPGPGASIRSPVRLPFQPQAWAFSEKGNSAVVLTPDGGVWTWGVRLGAIPAPSPRRWLESVLAKFSIRLPMKSADRFVVDVSPYKLWELPSSVRNSLGTKSTPSAATNQPATAP